MANNKISMKEMTKLEGARHVLGLSGGKDSAALAIYIKDRYPEIHDQVEYFFSDTGAELKEVYDFLDKHNILYEHQFRGYVFFLGFD